MRRYRIALYVGLPLALVFVGQAVIAQQRNATTAADAIPHSFQAGEPAVAAEVNDNFAAVAAELDALSAELDALSADVAEASELTAFAFGTVNAPDGLHNASANVRSVEYESDNGTFRISIDGFESSWADYTTVVTPTPGGSLASFGRVAGSVGDDLRIELFNADGDNIGSGTSFSFVVYDGL